MHTESRRAARKAFLALSGISNDEDQDQIASHKSGMDENVAGSFEEIHASGNTPVSRTSVIYLFAACMFKSICFPV